MGLSEFIQQHLPTFALVLARFSGLFLFAPLLSSAMVPRRVRAAIVAAFAFAVYPLVTPPMIPDGGITLEFLAPALAGELLIGLSIGVIAAIPLMSAQLAGLIMGQQMGLGLASVINPAIDIEGDTLGQFLFFGAITGFIAAGGLDSLFAAVTLSFHRAPLLSFAGHHAPLELLVAVVDSGFEVAVRVAMPVLGLLLIETIAMGFLMRTLPSLNVMTLGFPIRILLGLSVLVASVAIVMDTVAIDVELSMAHLLDWTADPLREARATPDMAP